MIGRCEQARVLREEIVRLINEGLAGHIDLQTNAEDILAAAQALVDTEWDIEFHARPEPQGNIEFHTPAEPERSTVLERPHLRLVHVTDILEGKQP